MTTLRPFTRADFSIDDGINPDVILVGIGVELTQEVIACANLLRQDFPTLRVRVVNVVDLLIFAPVRLTSCMA